MILNLQFAFLELINFDFLIEKRRNIKINRIIFKSIITTFLIIGIISAYFTFFVGLGKWNINNHVVWGLDITSFIFWIGIGHSGTFISSVLLLFRQDWRENISRFSEVMTICAIITALLIPIFHIGRFWLFYWILPYQNQMSLWVNFKSALEWDFFAIGIYFISSLIYLYTNMIPDFNKFYKSTNKKIYFYLSLGWKGTSIQWKLFNRIMVVFSGLLTALVISVHTIVSFDFSVSILPHWHSTINPIFFVSGAIFSGIAMIFFSGLIFENIFPDFELDKEIIDKLSKLLVFLSLIMLYFNFIEIISFLYNSNKIEDLIYSQKFFGEYSFINYLYLISILVLPLFLLNKKIRIYKGLVLLINLFVLIGMWIERYLFVTIPLKIDLIKNSNSSYSPNITEYGLFIGSIGFFYLLFYFILKFINLRNIN